MELNEYQDKAMSTCMKSCNNHSYMLLNLVAEVGEFSGKLAKAIRKGQVSIGGLSPDNKNRLTIPSFPPEVDFDILAFDAELKKEAGDILWQLAGLCRVLGWSLDDIANGNLDKLASRQQRGVIDGDGDNR